MPRPGAEASVLCLALRGPCLAVMRRWSLLLTMTPLVLSGCGTPDTRALKKIACEQAAANLDMQSVSQIDALRKALGLAPGVDPIQQCRSLGASMEPPADAAGDSGRDSESRPGEPAQDGSGEASGNSEAN